MNFTFQIHFKVQHICGHTATKRHNASDSCYTFMLTKPTLASLLLWRIHSWLFCIVRPSYLSGKKCVGEKKNIIPIDEEGNLT